MKICTKCSTMNESYQMHCKNCGYNIISARPHINASQQQPNNYQTEAPDRPQFKSGVFSDNASGQPVFTQPRRARVKPINPDRVVVDSNDTIQNVEYVINEPDTKVEAYTANMTGMAVETTNDEQAVIDIPKSSNKWLPIMLSCLFVLTVGVASFYFINVKNADSATESKALLLSELFTEAERHYAAGNYDLAIKNYRQIVDQSSDQALVASATAQITEMNTTQINRLITNAEAALRRERYAAPAGDNAILYVNKVLAINPNHPVALDIQKEIVLRYESLVFEAAVKGDLETVKNCYETILSVKPYDLYAQEELRKVKLLMGQSAPQKNSEEAKQAKVAESVEKKISVEENLQAQQPALQKAENTQKMNVVPALAIRESAQKPSVVEKITPQSLTETDSSTLSENKEIIETIPATNIAKNNALSQETGIATVDEFDTDEGERVYRNKATPQLPANWDYKGYAIVRAECVVGIDGSVEKVKISSIFSPDIPSSQHGILKSISIETLKKYRYKAATRNGQPIRVNLKEALRFQ